jgi:polyhydroxybutyrate depolymerase
MRLVVQLHGRGIDAMRFDRLTGFRSLADEQGFVLALPSAVDEIWNDRRDARNAERADDVAYLLAMVEDIRRRADVDPRCLYLVGMSNGAAMAGRLAWERADAVTAFAQVAGTAGVQVVAGTAPARPVPIMHIHGSADFITPYAGGVRRGFRGHLLIRRSFGPSIGVEEWAQLWVGVNGAAEPAASRLSPDTTVRRWSGPTAATDVLFYRVEGGGHTWPNAGVPLPGLLLGRTTRSFDASRAIWEFLRAHDPAPGKPDGRAGQGAREQVP